MTLRELQEQRGQLLAAARERFDQINANTDESRAAELEAQHDAAMAELDALDATIERQQRMDAAQQRQQEFEENSRRAQRNALAPGDGQQGGQGDAEVVTYREAFHAMLRAGGLPSEMDPEHRAALRRGVQRSVEFRAQTAGTDSAGGFTVPTELSEQIIISMAAWGPMYSQDMTNVLNTTSGNPIDLPTIDDTGSTAEPHTEAAALTDDGGKDVTFGKKSLGAYAFDTEFLKWSMELASDSIFNIELLLGDLLGERLGRIANSKLTVGTGSGEPNGIVTASSVGITAAATAAITADEILNFVHSVDPAYRASPKARVMFNDNTLLALRKLKDGQGNYLITEAPDGTGRLRVGSVSVPYAINQAIDSLGAAKRVMVYGDFSRYFVRKVGEPVLGVMRERFWPDLGIAGLIRFDGELSDSAAVKHLITAAS